MYLGIVFAALVLLGVLALTARGGRATPPPARHGGAIVDWTRQWRRALDSLDRPHPGARPARNVPRPPPTRLAP